MREGHPYYTADQPKEAAAEYKGATWEERWVARSAGPGRVQSVPVLLPGGVRVEHLVRWWWGAPSSPRPPRW